MKNEVILEGWVGEKPQDYPEKEDKQRFVKFELALNPADSGKPAQWVRINAYGEVADKMIDGLWLQKGDRVRIEGYLSARNANPGCGRRHRFTVVCANEIELIEGFEQPAAQALERRGGTAGAVQGETAFPAPTTFGQRVEARPARRHYCPCPGPFPTAPTVTGS